MKDNIKFLLIVALAFSLGHSFGSRNVAELEKMNNRLLQHQKENLRDDLRIACYLSQTNPEAALETLIPKIDYTFQAAAEQVASVPYKTNDLQFFNESFNRRKTNAWMNLFSFTNWNASGSNLFTAH